MAKRQYRSRLVRKESQRLLRQSIFFFILTVVSLVGLVVWGVPTLVKLAAFLGDLRSASEPIEQSDTLAPYPPQLAVAYEATSSGRINVPGFAEANADVILFLDGNEAGQAEVNTQGEFVFEGVALASGENRLSATARDTAGNVSDLSAEKLILFDNQAPEIEITSPALSGEEARSEEKILSVEGKTEADARVYINERLARVDSEGGFRGQVALNEGENEVTVRVVDRAENETIERFSAVYFD